MMDKKKTPAEESLPESLFCLYAHLWLHCGIDVLYVIIFLYAFD